LGISLKLGLCFWYTCCSRTLILIVLVYIFLVFANNRKGDRDDVIMISQ